MAIKKRDLEKQLKSKFGFSLSVTRSDDHRWYEISIPGLPIIATKVSHGGKELSSSLESKIARQLRVRRPFFLGMISCNQSKNDYLEQVKKDPFPPFDVGF